MLECLREKNSSKETPLHKAACKTNGTFMEAVLDFGKGNLEKIEQLLIEKDENSNTPLHLATRTKRADIPPLLIFVKKKAKEPMRYLTKENIKGWTPFSGAVALGSMDMVVNMLQGLTLEERKVLVNQADFNNTSPLHVAAKYGHVDVFHLLLENGADIKRRGPDQHTALQTAIERDQRGIVRSIIESSHWEEAFQTPTISTNSGFDTPLRNLVRRFPDLAEEFLDRCCTVETIQGGNKEDGEEEVINMKYDFIEDTHSYRFAKNKEKHETLFCHKEEAKEVQSQMNNKNHPLVAMAKDRQIDLCELKGYEVDINDHPLMIMAKERRVDLLQHPLCLAITLKKWNRYGRKFYFFQLFFYLLFLLALNFFVLSSDSPLDQPKVFNCTGRYFNESSDEPGTNQLAHLNEYFRYILLVLNVARVVFFFANQEYSPIWSQLKTFQWRRPNLPTVFFFDALVYTLALFVACYNLLWTERSCLHWQTCAVTITLGWINLLFNMRLLNGIGKYVILFQDVVYTFFAVSIVFVIMIVGFAFSFHMLLSNRQEFQTPYDATLKTFMMMSGISEHAYHHFLLNPQRFYFSGEIEYSEIFFKDNPPEGFGKDWDKDWESVPFPFVTYGMFLVFFFFVSIVAINVLVGLTVDDIRNFLQNADLRKLTMRLKFILAMERLVMKKRKRKPLTSDTIQKHGHLEASATSDLISRARIWEKVEKKQEESLF